MPTRLPETMSSAAGSRSAFARQPPQWPGALSAVSWCRDAAASAAQQGDGDKNSPHKEPGIPKVRVPEQGPMVSRGGNVNDTGLDQQADGGVHLVFTLPAWAQTILGPSVSSSARLSA